MQELRSFRRTSDYGHAVELLEELQKHKIDGQIKEIGSNLDSSFGASEITREYELVIKPQDFERANEVFETLASDEISHINSDHYLFEFSNEELYDILLKPDEWSEIDYKLSIKILNDRGQNVDDALLTSLKKQRLADLAKPEESSNGWIIFGYISSALGGLLGLFLGWHIWRSTKTLPNGNVVYTYNAKDRSHGQIIFYIGLIVFPIAVIVTIFSKL